MKPIFVLLFCALTSSAAFAESTLDFGAIYLSDSLKTSAESSNTQYFYNFSALFNLDRRMRWNVGWAIFGISQNSRAASVETNYSSLDMGPVLRWNIDKNGMFSTTLAYGYLAKGAYASGSTDEKWEGSSYLGQFAVQLPLGDSKVFLGMSLNYYAASYSKKVVSSVESSNSSQKSWIFPMISLTWRP